MKRILSAFLALAVTATLVVLTMTSKLKHGVPTVHAQDGCSVGTLVGNYAVSQSGFTPKRLKGNPLPLADVGVVTFDGAGNASISYTDASNGVISPSLTGAGTYVVNSDCTGSISFTTGNAAGATANIVVIGGGTEAFGINTGTSVTATIDIKKQ